MTDALAMNRCNENGDKFAFTPSSSWSTRWGRRTSRFVVGLMFMAVSGCGPSGPEAYEIRGKVTFAGKAIPAGTMTLIPMATNANTVVAKISEGQYAAKITEGTWTVNIQAVRETGPVIPALREAPREQYIPPKYNRESKLTVTAPPGSPEQDFSLEP